jgi:tRNA 5-methylaminomethyl-2-thiouridine biosynthesis bifunctional protein
VGFEMRRVDQRPQKRHSLAGIFRSERAADPERTGAVVVVGAGLAGAATARQIAERGIAVTVLDGEAIPPNRIAATVLHCRLLPHTDAAGALRSVSFNYATAWYDRHHPSRSPGGLLQLPGRGMNAARLEQAAARYAHTGNWVRAVDANTASALAGKPLDSTGLYFPQGRAIDLGRLCTELLHHPLIEVRTGIAACALATDTDRASVATSAGTIDADHIVLCTAAVTNSFEQTRYLELVPVAGQIDVIQLTRPPAIPLVGEGFIVPLGNGWGVGATYEHRPWPPDQASAANLAQFTAWWQRLTGELVLHGGTTPIRGNRAVTSDRRPIVGGVYDFAQQRLPRLLLSTGHGSQGTTSAPFAAECIASELAGEFAPATRSELAAISSLRFRLRQARRGLRHGAR